MNAKVLSSARIVTNYPFRCLFDLEFNGDIIKGAFVGGTGKIVSEVIRQGDDLDIRGHWITEKSLGKLFIIENTSLPKEAKIGRLTNYYA